MLDDNKLEYIERLLKKCEGVSGTESRLIKGDNGTFGIEFEGYQSLRFEVSPIFDMSDEEVENLLMLIAIGVPFMQSIVNELKSLENAVTALVDAIATVALVSSKHSKQDLEKAVTEEKKAPTVGEK